MVGGMKFDESSLTGYLVNNLEPLTDADPVILAEYVQALLKKEKPTKELQNLCTDNLVEFLGHDTESFVTKLFQALQDGSIETSYNHDPIDQIEPSSLIAPGDNNLQTGLSPRKEKVSSSCHISDAEEKEVTDDDDDDRNHKHRRRETLSLSSDKDMQEPLLKKLNKNRENPYANGQMFLGNGHQSSGIRKELNPASVESAKFEKWRRGLTPLPQASQDLGQRTRGYSGPHFDLSLGRGRGQNTGLWSQHDLGFRSVDTLDFASQMVPQGSTPGLFTASTQGVPWVPFGLIHGNGGLDALHPLGMRGTIPSPINPLITIAMPRQRCRDFEERGFCLRGDMCPLDHGVNRIVVEDIQSLSQFNFPASLPNAPVLGMQGGTVPLPPFSAPSSLLTNSQALQGKSCKSGVADEGLHLNAVLPGSASGGETDLYDPDQPLWINGQPEISESLLRLPSPKIDDRSKGDSDNADYDNSINHANTSIAVAHSTNSSVWGRIRTSRNRLVVSHKGSKVPLKNKKEGQEMVVCSSTAHGRRSLTEEVHPKALKFATTSKPPCADAARDNHSRGESQKASRTLFVNGIPLENNKKEALLCHFQKFGEVIDICIPHNCERAFVQFSRREEAEAALKAPDAVMGNRFIKLWWANRDSVSDQGESSGNSISRVPRRTTAVSATYKPSVGIVNKSFPSAPPKVGNFLPTSGVSIPINVPQKIVVATGAKPMPPLQKKRENLEFLKEELRKKQEMLEQKRDDFRRQLNKLENEAMVSSEVGSEEPVKRHKMDAAIATVKSTSKPPTLRPINPSITPKAQPEAETVMDKSFYGEMVVSSNSSKRSSIIPQQQSPRSLKLPSRFSGSHTFLNKFKLDNRPTSFKILPPLPTDCTNVITLKEYFSSFGDLSSVELEDPEAARVDASVSKPPELHAVRITFTTRRSAEKAFLSAKSWQGHNLQLTWLTHSSNSSSIAFGNIGKSPTASADLRDPTDAETGTAESSSCTGKSTSSVICKVADTAGVEGESKNVEGVSDVPKLLATEPEETCSSHAKQPVVAVADLMNVD